MKKAWFCLGLIGIALALGACSNPPVMNLAEPQPCMIPTDLPDDAMGKLGIRIIRIGDKVRVILPSDNIFVVNTAIIQDSAVSGLDLLAKKLKNYGGVPMVASAYTDELGTPAENKWLAEQQARSIQTFLWTRGFDHFCITPVGVGEDFSGTVASNRSILGSAANRRVEITFRAIPRYDWPR